VQNTGCYQILPKGKRYIFSYYFRIANVFKIADNLHLRQRTQQCRAIEWIVKF
jgi:hypothetical protein